MTNPTDPQQVSSQIDYTGPAIVVEDSPGFDEPWGPDHTKTAGDEKEKSSSRKPKNPFGKLGQNKQRASGVRQLVKADREKIVSLYQYFAFGLMPFKPATAEAIADSAETCADAWFELAHDNDAVRKMILALVEGGAWGKVMIAHTPILLSLVPENHPLSLFKHMNNIPDDVNGLSDDNRE